MRLIDVIDGFIADAISRRFNLLAQTLARRDHFFETAPHGDPFQHEHLMPLIARPVSGRHESLLVHVVAASVVRHGVETGQFHFFKDWRSWLGE
jgi:hypothetical protein